MSTSVRDQPDRCRNCGTELPPHLLRCPGCQALVNAEQLQRLAQEASAADTAGDVPRAVERWQTALSLLPGDAPQAATIRNRLEDLDRRLRTSPALPAQGEKPKHGSRGWLGGIGAAILLALGKIKFLLLGLTKLSTLFSMIAFFGVYWSIWGWKFALGFVLTIYIHEMGHVFALRHYGIHASAPMFIPGVGAFVRLHSYPPTPAQDARVGLAGPLWGTGAAIICWLAFQVTHESYWGALAHVTAVINLFNLIPVWQLDGARGIRPLNQWQRIGLLAAVVGAYFVFREGVLLPVGVLLAYHSFRKTDEQGDWAAFQLFAALLLVLALLSSVRVPGLTI
jgi:Zn-dependent protease